MKSLLLPTSALQVSCNGYALLKGLTIVDCTAQFAALLKLDQTSVLQKEITSVLPISVAQWQTFVEQNSSFSLQIFNNNLQFILFPTESTEATDTLPQYGLMVQQEPQLKSDRDFFELFKDVHSSTPDALMITDSQGVILHVNSAFERLSGFTNEEAVGKSASLLKSMQHDPTFYDAMQKALQENGVWEGSIWNRRKDGETIPCHLRIVSHNNTQGGVQFYASIITNLAELAKSKDVLSQVLLFDPLTQLESRSGFLVRLSTHLRNLDFNNESLAVLAIDLSNFRRINTTYGHLGGDLLLKEFSHRLRQIAHPNLVFARLGSDEFLALTHQNDPEIQLGTVFEAINKALKAPVLLNDESIFLSVTIGVAVARQGNTAEALIKQSDAALYQAKETKIPYVIYDGHLQEQAMRDLALSKKLKYAIENNELEVFYQPKIDLRSGQIHGMEALARWRDESGRFIPPNIFIPLAEKNGLINHLFQVIVAKTIRDMSKTFLPIQNDLVVSINLSAHQFEIENLVQEITCQVDRELLAHQHFEFEVTESVFIDNMEVTRMTLIKFKEEGFLLSLDDFGTGFSSLTYLNNLPFDTLKIDKSFVDPVPLEDRANAMTRSIVNLAHSINLSCVAEGVENAEQLQFLKLLGCDYCQGFYFSPPVDKDRFVSLLARQVQVAS